VDRLNRSLTGLSAQVCPRRPVRAGLSAAPFFSRATSFLTGRFLSAGGLACRFFFVFFLSGHSQACSGSGRHAVFFGLRCALASVREFFYPVSILQGAQQFFFLFLIDRSLPLLGAQIIIFFSACCRSAASVRATFLFFLFVLSGHFSSAGRVQNFFWTLLLSPRAMLQTFSLCSVTSPHSHACVSGAPAIFFLSSRFRSTAAARTVFFCHSLLFL
jgi:hypothetical protein